MNKNLILSMSACLTTLFAVSQSNTEKEIDSLEERRLLKEVVITGTRFEIPIEKSGKSIYTLSKSAIEKNSGKSVADLLNEVPGIQMEGNYGSPGTNISLFVRGGRTKNVLILIDGVPVNDPTGINAWYDLNLLALSQVESIEVLKGGLSTLYGTGASSAVINISLKKASARGLNGAVDLNVGSYGTTNINAILNGSNERFNYMISANSLKSDGFSSASDENSPEKFVKDGFDKKNILLKTGFIANESFSIDGIIGFDKYSSDYDDGAFLDAENIQKGELFRIGLSPTFKYNRGKVEMKLNYGLNKREFISSYPTEYAGRNFQWDITNTHKLAGNLKGLWGVNIQNFAYEQPGIIEFDKSKFNLIDPYASVFYTPNNGFNMHLGARMNSHSEYGSKFVYNINPSYLFRVNNKFRIKLLATVSTSFITPTGYQLYSDYGNLDLKPEESLNIEFGSSFYLKENLKLNIVYFERSEENAIDFVSKFDPSGNWIGGAYENLTSERDVNGFEMDVTYLISDNVSISANYSHAEADDPTTFYRIPNDKYGAVLNINLMENSAVTAKYHFTGERTIFDYWSFSEMDLDSYGLFDLYVQQSFFNENLLVYGALNNAFDTDFVSVYGFTTKGRNFNVGLKYNF